MAKPVVVGPFVIKGKDAKKIRKDVREKKLRADAKKYATSPGARSYTEKHPRKLVGTPQQRVEKKLKGVAIGTHRIAKPDAKGKVKINRTRLNDPREIRRIMAQIDTRSKGKKALDAAGDIGEGTAKTIRDIGIAMGGMVQLPTSSPGKGGVSYASPVGSGEEIAAAGKRLTMTGAKAIDLTARPSYGIAAGTKAAIKGDNIAKGIKAGVTGKDRGGFTAVLKSAGVKNGIAASVGGFIADVFADPTTYITLGAGVPFKVSLASLERAAFKEAGKKGYKGALREAYVKEAVRKGKPKLAALPTNKGLRVGVRASVPFTKKTFEGMTKGTTTAKISRATGLSDKATKVRNTRGVQAVGGALGHDFRRMEFDDLEHGTLRRNDKQARSKKHNAQQAAERRGHGLQELLTGKAPKRVRVAKRHKFNKAADKANDEALVAIEAADNSHVATRAVGKMMDEERAVRKEAGLSAKQYDKHVILPDEEKRLRRKHKATKKRVAKKLDVRTNRISKDLNREAKVLRHMEATDAKLLRSSDRAAESGKKVAPAIGRQRLAAAMRTQATKTVRGSTQSVRAARKELLDNKVALSKAQGEFNALLGQHTKTQSLGQNLAAKGKTAEAKVAASLSPAHQARMQTLRTNIADLTQKVETSRGRYAAAQSSRKGSQAGESKVLRQQEGDSQKAVRAQERGKASKATASLRNEGALNSQRIKVRELEARAVGRSDHRKATLAVLDEADPRWRKGESPADRMERLGQHPSKGVRNEVTKIADRQVDAPPGYFPQIREGELEPGLWKLLKAKVRNGGKLSASADKVRKVRLGVKEANIARGYKKGHPEAYVEDVVKVATHKWKKGEIDGAIAHFWTGIKSRGKAYKGGELALDEGVYKTNELGKLVEVVGDKEIAKAVGKEGFVVLPRGYFNAAEKLLSPLGNAPVVGGEIWNHGMGAYKFALTVPMPSYHIRNLIGDSWNAWLGEARIANSRSAAKVMMGRHARNKYESSPEFAAGTAIRPPELDKTIKINGVDETIGDLIDEAESRLVIGGGFIGEELPDLRKSHGAVEAMRRFAQIREDAPRMASYISARQRGLTPEQAAAWVDKHHFDYGDLTAMEKVLRQTAIPFWTFYARNTRLQVATLFQRPGKFATVAKAFNLAARTAGYDDYQTYHETALEPYQQLGLPFPVKIKGKLYSIDLALPTSDLKNLTLNPVDQINFMAARVHAMKLLVELPTDYSFFFQDSITGEEDGEKGKSRRAVPAWLGQLTQAVEKGIPGVKFGARKTWKDGKWVWTWPAKVDYVWKQLPETSFLAKITLSLEGRGKDSTADALLGVGGVNVKPIDTDVVKLNALYKKRDVLNSESTDIKTNDRGYRGPKADRLRELERLKAANQREIETLSRKVGRPTPFTKSGGGKSSTGGFSGGGGGFSSGGGGFSSGGGGFK